MTLSLLPITLLLAVSPVHVEAELCPSGREIEAALAAMLPESPGSASEVAHVYQQGKLLRVELFNPLGDLVGERWLDDSDRCAELAVQVAVVIASLRSDVHREFPHPTQEVPTAPSMPPPSPSAPPQPKRRSSYDAALGVAFSYSDSLALGASLAGLWVPRGVGLGVRLSAGAETSHSLSFSEGRQATWRRWTATSEADWRGRLRAVVLDAHAGLAWTILTAKGEGFRSNGSDSSFSPGAHAGLRLSLWPTTRLAVWLGLDATCWLVSQSVAATASSPGQPISRFAGMATLGLAIGRAASLPLGSTGLAAQ